MADETVKSTEYLVGSGHATLTDTLNRLSLVEHNNDGTHKTLTNLQLVTPTIGVATATTVNKVVITEPATSATLTIIDGTTITTPPETSTVGYLNIPQQSKTDSYTCVLGDAGKHVYLASGAGKTLTIPANASVAYIIGTAITFINMSTSCTIAITSDTLYLAGIGTTGSRTLAQYGIATAIKMTATTWMISGAGLS